MTESNRRPEKLTPGRKPGAKQPGRAESTNWAANGKNPGGRARRMPLPHIPPVALAIGVFVLPFKLSANRRYRGAIRIGFRRFGHMQ